MYVDCKGPYVVQFVQMLAISAQIQLRVLAASFIAHCG